MNYDDFVPRRIGYCFSSIVLWWCLAFVLKKNPSSDLCMTCNPWSYLTHLYLNAYLASSSDAHFLLHHMHIALPAANKFLILLPSVEPAILGWNLSWILDLIGFCVLFVFVLLESLFLFVKIWGVRSVQLPRSYRQIWLRDFRHLQNHNVSFFWTDLMHDCFITLCVRFYNCLVKMESSLENPGLKTVSGYAIVWKWTNMDENSMRTVASWELKYCTTLYHKSQSHTKKLKSSQVKPFAKKNR